MITSATREQSLLRSPESIYHVDALVYLSVGKLAKDSLTDYSIATAREIGKWQGKVFIITDHPDCFEVTKNLHDVELMKIPSQKDIMQIKSIKANLFLYLPAEIQSILYIDVDIVITKKLDYFLYDLKTTLRPNFDMAAFYDARGHYVGFCSGCEKWHTGVLLFTKSAGKNCLKKWQDIILSGQFDTDQESLDEAENSGVCDRMSAFPSNHLLFAKDYIGMMLTSGSTFLHMTAAARIESQDPFYSNVIVPYYRWAYKGKVDYEDIDKMKYCAHDKD
jgi:hypothetical protein